MDWPGPESREFGASELEGLIGSLKKLSVFRSVLHFGSFIE